MVQICYEGVAKRMLATNKKAYFLIVREYSWGGGIEYTTTAFTLEKEGIKRYHADTKLHRTLKLQLLSVIPTKRGWIARVLEEYERKTK